MKKKYKDFTFEDLIEKVRKNYKAAEDADSITTEEDFDNMTAENIDRIYANIARTQQMIQCAKILKKEINNFLESYNKNEENVPNRKKIELFQ